MSDTELQPGEPEVIEMNRAQKIIYSVRAWLRWNVWNKIPRLVWYGDEVDVTVTFSEDPMDPDDPEGGLYRGGLAEIETQFRHMGITFDKGQGCGGRDWEWDWSLEGPVNLKFRSRAKKPEKRFSKKPKLTLVN